MENEQVVGVIPNVSLKKGLFRSELFTLVVTSRRLIAAKWSKQIYKQEVDERKQEARREGKGKLKQLFAGAGTMISFADRYLSMNPDEILGETEGSFAIEPRMVQKIKFKAGYFDQNDNSETLSSLLLVTTGGKLKFSFKSNHDAAVQKLLPPLLGRKL